MREMMVIEIAEKEVQTFTLLKAVDENGNIVGFSRGYIQEGTSYIGKTFVHIDYQGKGIGSQLITKLDFSELRKLTQKRMGLFISRRRIRMTNVIFEVEIKEGSKERYLH